MNEDQKMEILLGGTLEDSSSRVVPGTEEASSRKVMYFSDDGKNNLSKQFKNLTCFTNPPFATAGGVCEAGCQIIPSGGPTFHAIVFHGDIAGWTKDIEAGASGLGLLLAQIDGDQFSISDNRKFLLCECEIRFT